MENHLEYYKNHAPMTDPGGYSSVVCDLPRDIGKLCEIIQGFVIHRDMAPFAYDVRFSEERRNDANIRPLEAILRRTFELDDRPITVAREKEKRFAGVCRHFTLMLCGILRAQGVPARARCGFGAYFNQGKFEDHWVGEYWNARQSRWILVDAQLDVVQKKIFKPDFDPLDVPHDRFIIAGDAWQTCRSGRAEASNFGLSMVPGLKGMWFIAGNVLRDLASLNRAEMLPWDAWGLMPKDDASLADESMPVLDRAAALTIAGDDAFAQVRALYDGDDRLRVPPVVFNVLLNAEEKVSV
ncbi:MAG: transglutaminase-like domain-containing protein [Candidatus Binatus sp.]|uniref:transglutaminase-like domain-containing protein n=1 Tax=Candidatus Binatus sp. TaxID=2811406 RepID=UPI00272515FA|nr:transglutaminase-like domain-containing protein [Candidatus Binatus sp.]MDO8433273.1 transglutaminase-like domain-containing protein [Candidatus Binatus sp.]